MADKGSKQESRRAVLKGAALIAGLAAIPPAGLRRASAAECKQGAVPKAAMKYQDHPHGKDDCSRCQHFCPGKSPTAMGECTVVAGPISPHGWCVAFAAKS